MSAWSVGWLPLSCCWTGGRAGDGRAGTCAVIWGWVRVGCSLCRTILSICMSMCMSRRTSCRREKQSITRTRRDLGHIRSPMSVTASPPVMSTSSTTTNTMRQIWLRPRKRPSPPLPRRRPQQPLRLRRLYHSSLFHGPINRPGNKASPC